MLRRVEFEVHVTANVTDPEPLPVESKLWARWCKATHRGVLVAAGSMGRPTVFDGQIDEVRISDVVLAPL